MADPGHDQAERRAAALKRFRMMQQETTDPLASRLMRDLISELETEEKTRDPPAMTRD